MADTLCAISFIVILFLSIYVIVKHEKNKADKFRLYYLERYVRDFLIPNMYEIQRRLDYLEYKSQDSRSQVQVYPVAEPARESFHHYVHRPFNDEVPSGSYIPESPEPPMPIGQVAPPTQPYSQDKETISMEVEFGSKWLQYIGLFIVIITLLLLGAYAIRYITPLQENILMYLCSVVLLMFGEYLYRVKDSQSYGLGLVFGGLIAMYISCASSHYIYGFIEFQTFILFVIFAAVLNLLLGFRYDSNLMIFKGLIITFIIVSIMRLEDFVTPLEYSILLPMVTAIGSIVIFLRKNLEMLLFFMVLSYIWVIISVLHIDKFFLIPFFSVIAINMMLIMVLQKDEERLSAFVLFDEKMGYPLLIIALGLSYFTLLITTPIIIQAEAGNLIFHDGWISLIVLFTFQLIFTTKMKLRETDVILPVIPFICLMLMGLFTVNADGSIYFYLAMIFFVLAMNYKALSNGKNLSVLCILTVVMLILGKVLFRLSDIDPTSSFAYFFEGMLIFFTISFSYLNYRYNKDTLVIDDSVHKKSPVLFCLFLLCFVTNPTLSLGYFLIPIILLFAAYIVYDVLTFNLSYLILTYTIFTEISGNEIYYEIFIVSSLVLFFFALLHEIIDRKRLMAISTAGISSIMFMASIAITYRYDITTTLAWAGFGILSVIVGLKSNTYYFRWIGLFFLLISTLKAFTVDISVLSFEMRILSFAVLGFVLLIISYIYTRYKSKILESLGLKDNPKESQNIQYPPHRPPPGE